MGNGSGASVVFGYVCAERYINAIIVMSNVPLCVFLFESSDEL